MYYVFLKEINRIIKEKGKENLNDIEEISYLIEKGNQCDRINMTKVGRIMKRKYDQFMEDMNLREEAWAYEKAEFDNPPFDRSPVDGYACHFEDLSEAKSDTPV